MASILYVGMDAHCICCNDTSQKTIAMPKSTANLSVRFPKETWDYVVI